MQLTERAPAAASKSGPRAMLVASKGHLAGYFLIVALVTAFGFVAQSRLHGPSVGDAAVVSQRESIETYLSAAALDIALLRYCWVGARRRGGNLAALSGGRWTSWKSLATDIAIAVPFWIVWQAAAYAAQTLLGSGTPKALNSLAPRTNLEVTIWIGVAIIAGFCEEIVYRGYLQQQLHALSGSLVLAIVAQGFVFGLVHSYQGWKQVLVISFLGIIFGVLAAWRRNLRANVIVHAWSDIWGGWLQAVVAR